MFVAEISLPVALIVTGLSPSNPHCRGITNFLCAMSEFDNVIVVEAFAAVETFNSVAALSSPLIFNNENTLFEPVVAL